MEVLPLDGRFRPNSGLYYGYPPFDGSLISVFGSSTPCTRFASTPRTILAVALTKLATSFAKEQELADATVTEESTNQQCRFLVECRFRATVSNALVDFRSQVYGESYRCNLPRTNMYVCE